MPKAVAFLGWAWLLAMGGLGAGCERKTESAGHVPEPVATLNELERRDGRLWPKGATSAFSGMLRENYPDGAVKALARLRDGQIHGGVTGYFGSGRIQMEESFVAGVSEGVRRRYFEDGTVRSTEEIVGGKLHGRSERFHTNGVLAERSHYQAGQPHGVAEAWDEQGRAVARVVFESGRVVEQTFVTNGIAPSGDARPNAGGRLP